MISPNDKRIKEVGPDRACAEWLLRNGASVRWKNHKNYLQDYNTLGDENIHNHLEAVDATNSAIHHYGFPHFSGCKYIQEVKLVKCSYIKNEALFLLSLIKDSLQSLEIIECKNITDEGLLSLQNLHLKNLKFGKLPYVQNGNNILSHLKSSQPDCKIIHVNE